MTTVTVGGQNLNLVIDTGSSDLYDVPVFPRLSCWPGSYHGFTYSITLLPVLPFVVSALHPQRL